MRRIQNLSDQEALRVAECLCRFNKLSKSPLELLATVNDSDRILVDCGLEYLHVSGFRNPTSGFAEICDRFGMYPVREKCLTLRDGGDRESFLLLNKTAQSQDIDEYPDATFVARMRLNNTRAVRFNLNCGFEIVGTYKDSVNNDQYLLTRLTMK